MGNKRQKLSDASASRKKIGIEERQDISSPKQHEKCNDCSTSNPLFHEQENFLKSISSETKDNFFCDERVDPSERAEIWMKQAELGEYLVNKYAWATPNKRALNILKYFEPIVEIGSGSNGYWSRLMYESGIDVVAFDSNLHSGGKIDSVIETHETTGKYSFEQDSPTKSIVTKKTEEFRVLQGGPDVLCSPMWEKVMRGRTLFLCYPDDKILETESVEEEGLCDTLGSMCLEYFAGDVIIHVGELFADTLSFDQAPWGRSSGSLFQQRLASEYHCILKANLPSWIHVRDTVSVWKRTRRCSILYRGDDDCPDEEVEYRFIPKEEMLPSDVAAPCVDHLLR